MLVIQQWQPVLWHPSRRHQPCHLLHPDLWWVEFRCDLGSSNKIAFNLLSYQKNPIWMLKWKIPFDFQPFCREIIHIVDSELAVVPPPHTLLTPFIEFKTTATSVFDAAGGILNGYRPAEKIVLYQSLQILECCHILALLAHTYHI